MREREKEEAREREGREREKRPRVIEETSQTKTMSFHGSFQGRGWAR